LAASSREGSAASPARIAAASSAGIRANSAPTSVLLQGGRLKVAGALRDQPVLVRELLNFQVRIDPLTAHDSYGAWREGAHDDLVLAVALACWRGEHMPRVHEWPVIKAGISSG
jgi:hypothetical protein